MFHLSSHEMVVELAIAVSAGFGSAEPLTSALFIQHGVLQSGVCWGNRCLQPGHAMAHHIVLLERQYFKPLILKVLCHLLQNI